MGEKVEVVIEKAGDLMEGPCWDERTKSLLMVDLFHGKLLNFCPHTKQIKTLDTKATSSSIILPRDKGGYLVNRAQGLATLDTFDNGSFETVATFPEPETNIMNDGKVDAAGRVWIGSCSDGRDIPDANDWPKGRGSLYSFDLDGSIKKHMANVTISNGMAWTQDNSVMFYTDSVAKQVWAFDFDLAMGTIRNQRTLSDFSELGFPDGMCIDAEGKLWVACCGGSKVVRLDTEIGKVLRTVSFPVETLTSCCFGGEDYTDLYVTSLRPKGNTDPLPGSVFRVSNLGVGGLKPNTYPR